MGKRKELIDKIIKVLKSPKFYIVVILIAYALVTFLGKITTYVKPTILLNEYYEDSEKGYVDYVLVDIEDTKFIEIIYTKEVTEKFIEDNDLDSKGKYLGNYKKLENDEKEEVKKLEELIQKVDDEYRKVELLSNTGEDNFYTQLNNKIVFKENKNLASGLGNLLSIGLTVMMIYYLYSIIKTVIPKAEDVALTKESIENINFDNLKGLNEEIEEIKVIIDMYKNQEIYKEQGVSPTRGLLLTGPPGTGKTQLAKAMANESDLDFYAVSGSDFGEVYAGVGSKKIKSVFEFLKKKAPCILFIDEIDALGGKRSNNSSDSGVLSDRNQTLNTLLTEMDGIAGLSGVLIIGATNMVENIDKALLRPGRFDKQLHIGVPTFKKDVKEIVQYYLEKRKVSSKLNVDSVATLLRGFSGAEIENIINDATAEAIQEKKDATLEFAFIEKAFIKYKFKGLEKGEHTEDKKDRVIIHELGHMYMALALGIEVVQLSIKSYSNGTGGYVLQNEVDLTISTEIINRIKVLYAGRVSEKINLGNISSGAYQDLREATKLLETYVTKYAMSDNLVVYSDDRHSYPKNIKEEIEKLSKKIYAEVVQYFEREEVKSLIIQTKEILKDKNELNAEEIKQLEVFKL